MSANVELILFEDRTEQGWLDVAGGSDDAFTVQDRFKKPAVAFEDDVVLDGSANPRGGDPRRVVEFLEPGDVADQPVARIDSARIRLAGDLRDARSVRFEKSPAQSHRIDLAVRVQNWNIPVNPLEEREDAFVLPPLLLKTWDEVKPEDDRLITKNQLEDSATRAGFWVSENSLSLSVKTHQLGTSASAVERPFAAWKRQTNLIEKRPF